MSSRSSRSSSRKFEFDDISVSPPRHLFYLSNKILLKILSKADGLTLLRLSTVCKVLKQLARDESCWQTATKRDFVLPESQTFEALKQGAGSLQFLLSSWRDAWRHLYLTKVSARISAYGGDEEVEEYSEPENEDKQEDSEAPYKKLDPAVIQKFYTYLSFCRQQIKKYPEDAVAALERVREVIAPDEKIPVPRLVNRFRRHNGRLAIGGRLLHMRAFCATVFEMEDEFNTVTSRLRPFGRQLLSRKFTFAEDEESSYEDRQTEAAPIAGRLREATYVRAEYAPPPRAHMQNNEIRDVLVSILERQPNHQMVAQHMGSAFSRSMHFTFKEAARGKGSLLSFLERYPNLFSVKDLGKDSALVSLLGHGSSADAGRAESGPHHHHKRKYADEAKSKFSGGYSKPSWSSAGPPWKRSRFT